MSNFLTHIKQIVMGNNATGGGFLKDISISPSSAGTTATRSTGAHGALIDHILLDADGEDVLPNFTVPRDYDEALDHLKVFLLISYYDGTSLDVQGATVTKTTSTAIPAAISGFSAAAATTINAAFVIGEIEMDLSSLSIKRHDVISPVFTVSNRTVNGRAFALGIRAEYRSTLVSYDEVDANNVALR